jgi:ATP phosphoribosyltransferase regulatory subunit|tara:strand:+ start:476 stop:1660 length:1185 start_codon:yes stop_codon:yes gene_type:complete
MTNADRWLLPDGVEEILPVQAQRIERLRGRLVDLYRCWGYDLVIPPLVEFTDSLLIGLGRDVDLMTFKVTDQISGRTMGIRADITPQTARMDAHSFIRQGPSRLCYAGHVLHTKPKHALATRTPIQAGAELYGEQGLDADIEVVSLLLASLQALNLPKLHIDLDHVGIYRSLAATAGFNSEQEEAFFELLQRKAATEINAWVADNISDVAIAELLLALPNLAGDRAILDSAKQSFAAVGAVAAVAAIDELMQVADAVAARFPAAQLYFDLSELRGYHYHTGIVFAAYAPGYGIAIANGGRYDQIGEVFGRARPATGFTVDVSAVNSLALPLDVAVNGVFAAKSADPGQWQAIENLRAQGERVVCGFAGQEINPSELNCDRQLLLVDFEYQVVSL